MPRQAGGSAEEAAAAAAQVAAVVESTNRFVRETFPHVEKEPCVTQSCMYTTTADHGAMPLPYCWLCAPAAPDLLCLLYTARLHPRRRAQRVRRQVTADIDMFLV